MSAAEFRPSTPADAPAITELCRRALHIEESNPMFEPDMLHWKYWRPWPTGSSARSHVIARGGELLAHIAAVPVRYRFGANAFTLLHPLDWAARPDVVGVGATLLQKLAKVADGVLVVGGSSMTQRMLGPLGYRRLPDVLRYVATPNAEALGALEVRAATEHGAPPELGGIFEPQLVAERSAALYQAWRECPAVRTQGYTVLQHGDVLGGFLLAQTPGQARLIDLWCAAARPDEWARVIGAARSEAARLPGVAEVVSLANTPLEQQALAAAGFRECGRVPMSVRCALLPQGSGLRFQMMDGDVAYLHHGKEESWLA
jgi:hypothetical protein